jgi:hypothetical protein
MNVEIGLTILYGFLFSFVFLLGGLLRIILRPLSNLTAYRVPWLFCVLGFILGKENYFPEEKNMLYWPFILSLIIFTFIIRTIVCNIEHKKTGKIGYFSDSGNMLIIGAIIGIVFKQLF